MYPVLFPSHSTPVWEPVGPTHVLVLEIGPLPQVTEHVDQALHGVHVPATIQQEGKKKSEKKFYIYTVKE